MSLAARLLLAFGLVAVLTTALVGASVRGTSRQLIEDDFTSRIEAAADGVRQQLDDEAQRLVDLFAPLCTHDTFLDKAHIALVRVKGDVKAAETDSLIGTFYNVQDQAKAYHLEDLVLLTGNGTILGARDEGRVGARDPRLAELIKNDTKRPSLRPRAAGGDLAMEVHCTRTGNGVTVGLVGALGIANILSRIESAYRLHLRAVDPGDPVPRTDSEYVVQVVDVREGVQVVASVPRKELVAALASLDRSILLTGAAAIAIATAVAIAMARTLSRPLEALAHETREVVSGAPKHVEGRGGREIAALAGAFNKTMDELTAMRKRLAATERIAARREVARQVAHEIKNPLAPIRAAVETLRRLRLRDDPAFDGYFEEATTTVLEEVHRIANIVTEFTRYNRMPAPNPEPIDLVQVARRVVTLHASAPDGHEPTSPGQARVELSSEPIPMVSADRDQIVQVLTNLIQNGLDAAAAVRPDPRVTVTVGPLPDARVRIVVRDNGPGVPEELLPRLFEPYATTKQKGTGLGLAIAQRIVFEHGGEISYRKAQKGGAVFEIALPVAGPPLLERPPTTDTTARPG